MKKAVLKITVVLMALLPVSLLAQKSPVDKLFDKYSGQDGFTSVDVAKGLFELFSEIEADDPDFDEFQKAVEGLEKLRLLACSDDEGEKNLKDNFYSDIMSSIPFDEYKVLMVVKDDDTDVKFYAKNNNQVITEMLMVVDGDDEVVLLSLTGNINLNHVAKLGTSMKLGGMEHLGKMKKSK
ncbi:MAG: DUF4252 domain-containing protein [Bacteroidetes bacterium]|nr:DUF4252 domain-containing protein [Bacteroidota bacterium]MBL7103410.1 DUF4252 domain-containing protein [Bacteroidales bacterium]